MSEYNKYYIISRSETLIRIRLEELEEHLVRILQISETESTLVSRSRTEINRKDYPSNLDDDFDQNPNMINSAKRSISVLNTHRPSSSIINTKVDDPSSNLYSKSASSIRDSQTFSSGNKYDRKSDEMKNHKSNELFKPKQISPNNKSGSLTLSSGYKYTPLRQSWSNLSQINQLSPYSSNPSSGSSVR